MYKLLFFVWLLTFAVSVPMRAGGTDDIAVSAEKETKKEAEKPGVRELIMGHVKDSYEWHFTRMGDKPVALYLPCIVYSRERGWFVFSSRHIVHLERGETYKGFYLADAGLHEGKIVEQNAMGLEKRPFDISLTKNVLGLFASCLCILLLVLGCARWYRKHNTPDAPAPKGIVGFVEMLVMMVYDDIILPCVGAVHADKYAPYLLTAFFFIFFNNLLGLVPIFPFGANLTGNIAVTATLALATFVAVNVFGNKHYWKEILWPPVPVFLKVPVPILPVIEIVGLFTKPFALMVRLFANVFAGHAIILALTSIIFMTAAMGVGINAGMSVASVLFQVFMLCLECLVAYIQAYVFTMLSAVFIGISCEEPSQGVTDN